MGEATFKKERSRYKRAVTIVKLFAKAMEFSISIL